MDMNTAVAKALQAERAVAGLTVRELAAKARLPQSTLMRVLQGTRDIKMNQVAQLADALKLAPQDIIVHAERIYARDREQSSMK